jgi:hypothetical protein
LLFSLIDPAVADAPVDQASITFETLLVLMTKKPRIPLTDRKALAPKRNGSVKQLVAQESCRVLLDPRCTEADGVEVS